MKTPLRNWLPRHLFINSSYSSTFHNIRQIFRKNPSRKLKYIVRKWEGLTRRESKISFVFFSIIIFQCPVYRQNNDSHPKPYAKCGSYNTNYNANWIAMSRYTCLFLMIIKSKKTFVSTLFDNHLIFGIFQPLS